MTTARDIMTGPAECARTSDTVADAARKMRDLDVGALPICGDDERLHGMITDRDIVTRCVAEGKDVNQVKVGVFAIGKPATIGADDSVLEALATMQEHRVRRLPVIDGHEVVGMLSQADLARHCPEDKIGQLVDAISSKPPNN